MSEVEISFQFEKVTFSVFFFFFWAWDYLKSYKTSSFLPKPHRVSSSDYIIVVLDDLLFPFICHIPGQSGSHKRRRA